MTMSHSPHFVPPGCCSALDNALGCRKSFMFRRFINKSNYIQFIPHPYSGSRNMHIYTVPVFQDNYAYLIVDSQRNAIAVDPADAHVVYEAAQKHQISINAIFTTHHHADHSGGNKSLLSLLPSPVPVYGGDDRIPCLTHPLRDNDTFSWGGDNAQELSIHAIHTPCHTRGSISYYVQDKATSQKAVFTGDTLFIGGCGRFFEGDGQQMYTSLEKLKTLPEETEVYCGHEYTKSNLCFAVSIDPNNDKLREKLEWAESVSCTIPSTIGSEKETNPFMRVSDPSIQEHVKIQDPIQVMTRIRELKNAF